jgi:hypothetical protein
LKFTDQILLLGPEGRPLPSPDEVVQNCQGLFEIPEVYIVILEVYTSNPEV